MSSFDQLHSAHSQSSASFASSNGRMLKAYLSATLSSKAPSAAPDFSPNARSARLQADSCSPISGTVNAGLSQRVQIGFAGLAQVGKHYARLLPRRIWVHWSLLSFGSLGFDDAFAQRYAIPQA